MIKKLALLTLCTIFSLNSIAQIQWYPSLDAAKNMARLQNKLILVDYTADWCPPCVRMDMYVWTDAEVDSLAKNFVAAKIDIEHNRPDAAAYNVRSIPRILIIDANGEVMENLSGYQDKKSLVHHMKSYPASMQAINAAMAQLNENRKEDFFGNYQVGLAYQKYLPILEQPAHQAFYNESIQYLKYAEKIASRSGEASLEEKAIIAQCLNYTYAGKPDKAIKKLEDKHGIDSFDATNQGYAFYVIALAYHIQGNQSSYQDYKSRLLEIPGGKYFAKMIDQYLASI